MKGKVKSLFSSYGFITPESSEEEGEEIKADIFFHKSGASLFYELSTGDTVEYEEGIGKKNDTIATTVEKVEQ